MRMHMQVKLHPLVIINISEHFTRIRSQNDGAGQTGTTEHLHCPHTPTTCPESTNIISTCTHLSSVLVLLCILIPQAV